MRVPEMGKMCFVVSVETISHTVCAAQVSVQRQDANLGHRRAETRATGPGLGTIIRVLQSRAGSAPNDSALCPLPFDFSCDSLSAV